MTRVGVVLMAYGTPADAGRHPAATTPTSGAGARRPTSSSPTSHAATRRSAACRRCWSAPRRSAARCRPRSTQLAPGHVRGRARAQARRSDDRGGGRASSPGSGVEHDRRRRAGAALLGALGRAVPRPARRTPPAATAWARPASSRGRPSRRSSTSSPASLGAGWQHDARRRRRVVFTAHSLPARIVEAGDPYPTELRATAEAVAARARAGRGRAVGDRAGRAPGRTPEPWMTPDILDGDRSPRRRPDGRRRARVRLRLRRRSPRGALRPRHRGPPAGRVGTASRSTAPRASTTIRP